MTVIEEKEELIECLAEHMEKILRCGGKVMTMIEELKESGNYPRHKKYDYDEYLKRHNF